MSVNDLLNRLSRFLDKDDPKLATFLTHMWNDQQNAVTYRELRYAVLDGVLSMDYLIGWQQDYSNFVVESYGPMVEEAVKASTKSLLKEYGGYLQDPQISIMDEYIRQNGARLVREISTAQFNAINTLVRDASLTGNLTIDQLARAIRPCIGLTERQSRSAYNLYKQLREDGVPHSKAIKQQARYAEKQHRYRAATIAQTEMARAYNASCDAVVQQNAEAGYVGEDSTKEWYTARDERVCPVCGAMHGEKTTLNGTFSNGETEPPGHPCCRCALKYNLTAPKKQAVDPIQRILGKTGDGFTDEQKNDMIELVNNTEGPVRDLWSQNVDKLNPIKEDVQRGVAHFDKGDGNIHLRIEDAVQGRIDQNPYDVVFHEYGHNIDYLNASGSSYLSTTYVDPKSGMKLGEQVLRESGEAVEDYYKRNLNKYILKELALQDGPGGMGSRRYAESLLRDWRSDNGISRSDERYKNLLSLLREADGSEGIDGIAQFLYEHGELQSDFLFEKVIGHRSLGILDDFAHDIKSYYGQKERSDISDMFAKYYLDHGGDSYPFGIGHDAAYFQYGTDNTGVETFAEMTAASVAQPESLAVIKEYFPKSYKMYIDMIRSVLK